MGNKWCMCRMWRMITWRLSQNVVWPLLIFLQDNLFKLSRILCAKGNWWLEPWPIFIFLPTKMLQDYNILAWLECSSAYRGKNFGFLGKWLKRTNSFFVIVEIWFLLWRLTKVEVKPRNKISSEEINKLVQTSASWLVETSKRVCPTPWCLEVPTDKC